MAKLPTSEALGQREFIDRSTVVTPTLDARANQAVVQAVASVNDRVQRSAMNKAKMQFQRAKIEADNTFSQDPDFETSPERYNKTLSDAAETASKLIRSPRMRGEFQQELSVYREQGGAAMQARAFSKEVDHGIANLSEVLTTGRENYLRASTQQDKDFARDIMAESIDGAEEAGYLDADKAQSMRQQLGVDLAVASVEIEEPAKQLELLKSHKGVMDMIPKDQRVKMIKTAETKLGSQVALETANVIRIDGGTRQERLGKVNKIKDPKVKSATRSQVISDFQQEETAKSEVRYNTFDEAAKQVIAGQSLNAYRAENAKEWESMDAAQQGKLIDMVTNRSQRKSDLAFYDQLNMKYQKDPAGARDMYLKGAHKLSDVDAKRWSDRFAKGSESDPLFSLDKEFNNRIGKTGLKLSDKSKGEALERLHVEWADFQANNPGKTPNAEQQKFIMDRVVGTYEEGYWSDTFNFQVERAKVVDKDTQIKMDEFDSIVSAYRDELEGGSDMPIAPFTDQEIGAIYKDALNRGLISE